MGRKNCHENVILYEVRRQRDRTCCATTLCAIRSPAYPSCFACLCLKSSATSLNECTPSTNTSISSNDASIHWSISTHTLPWCLHKCASCPSLFMPFIAATTFTLTPRSCIYEFRRQRETCKPKSWTKRATSSSGDQRRHHAHHVLQRIPVQHQDGLCHRRILGVLH